MKLELPLAILLLAIGGWHLTGYFTPQKSQDLRPVAEVSSDHSDANPRSNPSLNPVQQAAYLEPAPQFEPTSSDFEPNTDEPGILLAQAAKKLEMSPPISCKSRCKIHLFGQTMIGEGNYYQKGQGSGLTRLEIKYEISSETAFESTQVCDGKFYYWIQKLGDERTIEFIDLQKLKSNRTGMDSGPSQWLARSGTASLLRNLSTAFEFEKPIPTQLGDHKMLLLKGQWKQKSLESILHGQINHQADESIQWDQLPNQLPHCVEVYLGTDDFLHLFPYRISFFKFDKNGTREESPTMTLELYKVQKLDQLSDELFQVNAEGSKQIDLSGNYSDHIEYLAGAANEKERR